MPEIVEEDPVELMLKKTGCIDYHYKVQECIAEFGDWRHCQDKNLIKTIFAAPKNVPYSTKLALVVRTDLKMSKGKIAAQCSHAAVLCVQQAQSSNKKETQEIFDLWLANGQPKIVLRINGGYNDLAKLQDEAEKLCVVTAIVYDAGHTQLDAGTATVIGIGPDKKSKIDQLVNHLNLL
uniref:peptidyl-tRNA hydrolase n=1 Tax=Glossina brevipalpis TaxID=37001 RepID=A0A1A9WDW5_9MUSC